MIATKPTTNGHGPAASPTAVGGRIAPTSPKRLARIAGVLYLLVGIFGGFAQGFVYPKIYVAGDAAATAAISSRTPASCVLAWSPTSSTTSPGSCSR